MFNMIDNDRLRPPQDHFRVVTSMFLLLSFITISTSAGFACLALIYGYQSCNSIMGWGLTTLKEYVGTVCV